MTSMAVQPAVAITLRIYRALANAFPHEFKNVAGQPEYADVRRDLSDRLWRWMLVQSGTNNALKRIEDAEDVQFSFLREVCAVGENREGDMHAGN